MSNTTTLNITTLTASNGSSVLECWALNPGFTSSSQAGTTGAEIMQLGNLANASYSILPAQFAAGLHNAPNVQFVSSPILTRPPLPMLKSFSQMGRLPRRQSTHHPP